VEAAPPYHQRVQQQAPISSAPQYTHDRIPQRQQQLHAGAAASLSQLEQRNQEIEAQLHRWGGGGTTAAAGFHMVYSGAEAHSDSRRVYGGDGTPVGLSASADGRSAAGLATQPRSARADVERSSAIHRLEQLASMHESGLSSPAGGRRVATGLVK
jgi:hypothetical protein